MKYVVYCGWFWFDVYTSWILNYKQKNVMVSLEQFSRHDIKMWVNITCKVPLRNPTFLC
jgi:hypothetical protein